MASTCRPGDVLQASEGKTRFVRLARLLICGGTTVMRELFDYLIPPANLPAVLSSPLVKTRLTDMKNRKILTSPQWEKLYPPSGAGSIQSTSFDITLLFKLLRENMISGLSAPSRGWDKLPNIGDLSLPADMARIKYFRNGIAHADEKMELSEQEFSDYWKEIKDALMRIVGHYATSGPSTVTDWEMAIDTLLTESLTEEDRKHVEELKSWYLDERDLKEMVDHVRLLLEASKNDGKVFSAKFVTKATTFGAWLGGNIYILHRLKDHPDLLVDYVKYGIIPTGILVCCVAFGSIKLTRKAEMLDALDEFWRRYNTGQLKEDVEKVLITEELKNLANGERIELSVEINEEELMEIRKLLVEEEAIHETVKSFCILPPKPSHQIINRENEVERLLRNIEHKNTNEITVTYLFGNTGCGKSELERQVGENFYTNIAGQTTGGKFVFTLNASCIETLIHSYIEFTRKLGCPKDSIASVVTAKDASLEKKIMQLKGLAAPKLEKYSSWLMIIGNVRDLELVSKYFPGKQDKTSGNGQVLVTTPGNRVTAIDSKCTFFFSIKAGMRNIDAYKTLNEISTLSAEQVTISEVAKALDFQPLALAFAATYTRSVYSIDSSMTWTKFLEEHTSKAAAETDDETGPTYPASMRVAVMMALEKEMSDNILMLAFQFLSVMAPEPILLEYVVQYLKTRKPDIDDEAVAAKISSSYLVRISAEGSAVSVHQVVHDCLQIVMSRNKEIDIPDIQFLELLKMLKAFPLLGSYNTEEIEHIFEAISLLSHFLAFTRKLQHYIEELSSSEIPLEMSLETQDTANCLSLVGDICYKYGYYIASEICSEISSIIQENISDKNYSPQAAMVKKLAHIYLKTGKHQEARKCFERALNIQEKAYGYDDPRLATTLNEMGVRHRDLGQHQEARKCFERALDIQKKAYGDNDPRLATTLNEMGRYHHDVGHHKEAKTCFKRALDIQKMAYGFDDPRLAITLNEMGRYHRDVREHQEAKMCFERALGIQMMAYDDHDPRLATTLNELGVSHRDVRQYQEAKTCFERALDIQTKAYGDNDPRLASTLNELGVSHRDARQHQEAKTCFERALDIQTKAYGDNDPRLASTLNELGVSHRDVGQHQEARKCFERALNIQEKAYGYNDPRLATTLNELGVSHRDVGEHQEAKAYFERALGIKNMAYGDNDPRLATTLNELGRYHRDVREHRKAKTCFERALDIQKKAYGFDDPRLATTLNELGRYHRDVREHRKAKTCFERALDIQKKAYGFDDPRLATTLNELGVSHRDVREHRKAKTCFERALDIQKKAYDDNDPRLATTLNELGVSHRDLGQHQEAKTCFERALDIQTKAYGDNDPRLATTLNEMGVHHRDVGEHQEAKAYFERALGIKNMAYGDNDPRLATTLNEMGRNHRDVGEHQEAKTCFKRALDIQTKAYGDYDPRLASTMNELGVSHRDVGQHQEAITYFNKAEEIQKLAQQGDGGCVLS